MAIRDRSLLLLLSKPQSSLLRPMACSPRVRRRRRNRRLLRILWILVAVALAVVLARTVGFRAELPWFGIPP